MIAYRKTNGFAHDLRCVADDYMPEIGELTLPGWDLPALATLHDAQAIADKAAADAIIAARATIDDAERAQVKVDAQIQADLNMTPAEVDGAIDTLFPSFTAGQRAFLKRQAKIVIASGRKVLR